jgi:hypothetical protein
VSGVFSLMSATEPRWTVIRAGASIDGPALSAQLTALVRCGITSVACDVQALVPDAAAVDGLARLRVAARRLGCELHVRRASAELKELLAFVGLADAVLGVDGQSVEVRREPEEREERVGVEEERELDDPVS